MIDEDVGKSSKDAIEDKIIRYYVKRKLSKDHRQLLNDKISVWLRVICMTHDTRGKNVIVVTHG